MPYSTPPSATPYRNQIAPWPPQGSPNEIGNFICGVGFALGLRPRFRTNKNGGTFGKPPRRVSHTPLHLHDRLLLPRRCSPICPWLAAGCPTRAPCPHHRHRHPRRPSCLAVAAAPAPAAPHSRPVPRVVPSTVPQGPSAALVRDAESTCSWGFLWRRRRRRHLQPVEVQRPRSAAAHRILVRPRLGRCALKRCLRLRLCRAITSFAQW